MNDLDDERIKELPQHELVRKNSIEELAGHRDHALKLARQALTLLVEGEAAAKRAAPQDDWAGFLSALLSDRLYQLRTTGDLEQAMQLVERQVDGHAWASLQRLSGLRNLMDSTAHEQMTKQLSEAPPPFTVDNVVATFTSLAAQASSIFQRSLISVFERLDTKRYKSNSAFRIRRYIILSCVFGKYGYSYHGRQRELIGDLDRIFHMLDGKTPPEAGNASDLIEAAYRSGQSNCITKYFRVRMCHGNGNMHVTFRRRDLLDRANDMIASHYGKTLADNTKRG